MRKIIILVDYREQFWLTVRHRQASFKLDCLLEEFTKAGFDAQIRHYADSELLQEDLHGVYIVYQSSQDTLLLYKEFLTDVLLALDAKGAILLPEFFCFRAHHNKVFMEMLRTLSPLAELKRITSRWFGTFQEYLRFTQSAACFYPQVVKSSEGSGSRNVILVHNAAEIGKVKKMMHFHDPIFAIKDFIKSLWKSRYPNFRLQTNLRRKIVVQNFIPGLTGDYKVLVFGDHYYVLHRDVRNNDFRASGSGLFTFPERVSEQLLNFSRQVFESFRTPFISMDIAETSEACYLIEFQFVAFGTYTQEKAPCYYIPEKGSWQKKTEQINLETEFVHAISVFTEKGKNI